MDVITAAKLWMLVRPIRRLKNRRRAKRGLSPLPENDVSEKVTMTLPDGSTVQRSEPAIPWRTSTKAGIVGALVPLLGVLPFYDQINGLLLAACQSEQGPAVFLGGAGVAWATTVITARLTKSPAVPGKVL